MKRDTDAPLYVIRHDHDDNRDQVYKVLWGTVDSFRCHQAAVAGPREGGREGGKGGGLLGFKDVFLIWCMLTVDQRGRRSLFIRLFKKKERGAYNSRYHCEV